MQSKTHQQYWRIPFKESYLFSERYKTIKSEKWINGTIILFFKINHYIS